MRIHTLIAGIGLATAAWLDGAGAVHAQSGSNHGASIVKLEPLN
jgi:hypothetical protein